jgi:hypothetical protein
MGASMNATECQDGRIVEDAINWEQLRHAAKLRPWSRWARWTQ